MLLQGNGEPIAENRAVYLLSIIFEKQVHLAGCFVCLKPDVILRNLKMLSKETVSNHNLLNHEQRELIITVTDAVTAVMCHDRNKNRCFSLKTSTRSEKTYLFNKFHANLTDKLSLQRQLPRLAQRQHSCLVGNFIRISQVGNECFHYNTEF